MATIRAEWAWIDGRMQRGVGIDVADDGRIASVSIDGEPAGSGGSVADSAASGVTSSGSAEGPTRAGAISPRVALLPGFVNAHSHAFQRGLRGRGESYPAGRGDFWSWREAMYDLVQRVDRSSLKRLCIQAFREMLAGGFTTVGEFHYLHHLSPNDADQTPSGDFSLDEVVIEAAAEAGIRMTLLMCYYRSGGFNQALRGGQRRFATFDVPEFLAAVDRSASKLDPRLHTIGIAPHSLRAVPARDLETLFGEAARRGWPCHIHVEEIRKEIDDCRAALGAGPLQWLLDHVPLDHRTTIIHGTHSAPGELKRYIAAGGNVCVCPITEGNLGDGLGDVATMLDRPDAVCIGSDSNIRIDALEELRWLEFVRRLRHEKRGICKTPDGDVQQQLMQCGTSNGARSLCIDTGEIRRGAWADFAAIDLDHPSLADVPIECLPVAAILGSGAECIKAVCVGGRWIEIRT